MTPRGQSVPMEYEVTKPFAYENDLLGGRFRVALEPGRYAAKNEQEEIALDEAVKQGAARKLKKPKET